MFAPILPEGTIWRQNVSDLSSEESSFLHTVTLPLRKNRGYREFNPNSKGSVILFETGSSHCDEELAEFEKFETGVIIDFQTDSNVNRIHALDWRRLYVLTTNGVVEVDHADVRIIYSPTSFTNLLAFLTATIRGGKRGKGTVDLIKYFGDGEDDISVDYENRNYCDLDVVIGVSADTNNLFISIVCNAEESRLAGTLKEGYLLTYTGGKYLAVNKKDILMHVHQRTDRSYVVYGSYQAPKI